MNNAEQILRSLDAKLETNVELTLFGRAALQLGFEHPLADYALSQDVDAVLWIGQAEELNSSTNFWPAVEHVNAELIDSGLYISHFFVEDQIILRPEWRAHRKSITGNYSKLILYRLADEDLFLSKLMRDDPVDRQDALFILRHAGFDRDRITGIMNSARIPDVAEIQEQFRTACRKILAEFQPFDRRPD